MDDWHFSTHSLERALDMALEPEELTDCLRSPDTTYRSGPSYPEECMIYARGRIALAVSVEARTVITVLWNGRVFDRENDEQMWRDPT